MGKRKTSKIDVARKEDTRTCPDCGNCNIKTSEKEHRFPYGIGKDAVKLTAIVPVRKCSDCGFTYMDNEAEIICHDVICEHLGVMKPSQVKGLRNYYNLTQSDFSEITALGKATLSRWERRIVIQNKAYDNYLYLMGFKENLERIAKRREHSDSQSTLEVTTKKPRFRNLDVTDEVLSRRSSFKLNP